MRRKKRRNKKIFIIIGIIILVVLIINFTVNDKRRISYIEGLIKDTGLFISKISNYPFNQVSNKLKEYNEKKVMYEDYKNLKSEIEKQHELKVINKELEQQLKKMQDMLELNNNLLNKKYLNATVINRNIGLWYNALTIDKGSKNGIEIDMPVVVKEGLIGQVIKVTNHNSVVKLLTTEDNFSKISVKIEHEENYVMGILSRYNKDNSTFIVEGIDQNITIAEGSLVITTGLNEKMPGGIVVGKVKNITTDNFDLATILELESMVDFSKIFYVTVLQKEVIE